MLGQAVRAAENQDGPAGLLGAAHMHTPMFLGMLKTREDVKVAASGITTRRGPRNTPPSAARAAKTAAEALVTDPAWPASWCSRRPACTRNWRPLAARAGKHVFIEKPLGVGAKDAAEIAAAVEQAGVLFTTGYHLRTIPKYLFIKENIQQGHLGKIVRAPLLVLQRLRPPGRFRQGLEVDGGSEVGRPGQLRRHRHARAGYADVADGRRRGRLGGHADRDQPLPELRRDRPGDAALQERRDGNDFRGLGRTGEPVGLLVTGTEGHAVVFNDRLYLRTPKVQGADGARPWGKLPPGPDHPLLQFVSAIAGEKGLPLVTAAEAAARVKVMEALYQSARERKWVTVG